LIPPHVLVVMPLYNARPYVRTAIESILAQTYPNFSLLVINDGSTDGSEREAASFQDVGVTLWHQENRGPGAAMNRAMEYALDQKIPFLARMDADDISLPQRLETQIRLLEKHPGTAACSANCHYINAETEQIIGSSTVSTSPRIIRWEIFHGLRGLIQPASIFRTDALAAIGGYRAQFKLAEEVDVFLRLARDYELSNSWDFLCKIRLNPISLSMSNVNRNIQFQFYALDCAFRQSHGKPDQEFDSFIKTISWLTCFRIWREEAVLKLWRSGLRNGSPYWKILAAIIDPRRVIIRLLRKLDERKRV